MGKTTGFLEYERKTSSYRDVEERLKDYKEIPLNLTEDELVEQGARCMDCGVPFCHALGCPVNNLVPEFNDAVYHGRWKEAYERLELKNNLPEVTGRICPALCETSCTLSINSAPVTIKQIELAIIEKAFDEGWVVPRPPVKETGKKIAIIGSGPAGMSSAQQLRRMGHSVTLFEKSKEIGGILRYGIPDFKLEKHILDRRIKQMKAEGIEFVTDVVIGEDLSARYLQKLYDVILLTTGSGTPRDLPVKGRDSEGVYLAMEYLVKSNRFISGEISEDELISAKGKKVLVIGGGDTGSDCVGTANRQGAEKVYQFEIMPKPKEWDKPWNPQWPDWPSILRTSSSHEEGCERRWNIATKEFIAKSGKVVGGKFVEVEWKFPKDGGRPEMTEVPDSEFTLDVDMIVLAMGFVHVEHNRLLKELGVEFDLRKNISVDKNYATNVKGVYAAGDAQTGASLIVRAISHGRKASAEIDKYLKHEND